MIANFIRNIITLYPVQNTSHVYFENYEVSCVTFLPVKKESYFGKKVDGKFVEKLEGKILVKTWLELATTFPDAKLGFYKVKENEFSGMITVDNSKSNKEMLPIILSSFKSRSTKLLNQLHGTHGRIFWENNYKEFPIKNLNDLHTALQDLRSE